MADVSTTTGTYLSDLFDPQVIGGMIDEKLVSNIVFAPLATVDYTLEGRAGDTVTLPYFNYIGDAEEVLEGRDIPISKLTSQTKQVKIAKIGKGVLVTDEAVLSGYGDPIGEAVRQIVVSIASKADSMLLSALNGNMKHVYTPSSTFSPDDLRKALALFGEENDGVRVALVDADTYAELLNVKSWLPASEIAADVAIRGVAGMAFGCQILVSDRVKDGDMHIVKPGSLAMYMKRDILVETDRDIVNQSTIMTGSRLFAPYLYKPTDAIRIVRSSSSASVNLTGLTLGSVSLSPTFTADRTSYTAVTGNATNTVTATAEDSGATVVIKVGETTVENGSAATWANGENTLTVTVTNGGASKTYTVTVTKN